MFGRLNCRLAPVVDLPENAKCRCVGDRTAAYCSHLRSVANCSMTSINYPQNVARPGNAINDVTTVDNEFIVDPPPSPVSSWSASLTSSYLTPLTCDNISLRSSQTWSPAPGGSETVTDSSHSGNENESISLTANEPLFRTEAPSFGDPHAATAPRRQALELRLLKLDRDWNTSDLLAFLYSGEMMRYEPLGQLMIIRKIVAKSHRIDFFAMPYLYDCFKKFIYQWPLETIDLDDPRLGRLRKLWRQMNDPFPDTGTHTHVIQPSGYAWWLLARLFLKNMPSDEINLVCLDMIFMLDSFWPQYQIEIIETLIYQFHRIPEVNQSSVYGLMMQSISSLDRQLANQLIGRLIGHSILTAKSMRSIAHSINHSFGE